MDNLNKKMRQATKWSAVTEIAVKLVSPITNMILARLLMPEDFGVVATLTMIVSFAEIFTDAGFQKYLIQHEFEDAEDLELSTNVAFWTNLGFSVLLWCMIACFSGPIAALVGATGSEAAITVTSLQIPILAFSSIQTARYRRDFDFKTLFVVRMATALVPLLVTVPLAYLFRSYWALVLGTLTRDILNAFLLTVKSRWKPQLHYRFRRLKEMLSFSLWTIVENVSIWLTGYMDMFIIGIALNDYYLGLYKTTVNMVNGVIGVISASVIPVLFSALSRYQNDDVLYHATFLRFQRLSALLLIPLGFGMYVYRELCVSILMGGQWTEAEYFFGLWSLMSVLVIVLSSYNSEVFRSKGRPKISVLVQCLHLIFMIPMLMWSMDKGFEVLITVRSFVRLQMIFVSVATMHIVFGFRIGEILRNVRCILAASIIMALTGTILRTAFDSLLWELFTILLCVLIYTGVLLTFPAGRKMLAEIPALQKLLKLRK